jgi:hypothetical protein
VNANVVQPAGSEQGVANGMHEHIRVGMAQESFGVWNLNAAQNELAALDQSVKIKTDACSKNRIRRHVGRLPNRWLLKIAQPLQRVNMAFRHARIATGSFP